MNRNIRNRPGTTSEMLLRAAAFRAIAQGFAYPVADQALAATRTLATVVRQLKNTRDRRLERAFHAAARSLGTSDSRILCEEYQRLFLGNVTVSMHETAYGDGKRIAGRPAELADIAGFYLAFGFGMVGAPNPDLPDHLCAELEFYGALLIKSAYAGRNGWSPSRQVTQRALRSFLNDHLGRWVGAFSEALEEHNAIKAYRDLARALKMLVAAEARLLNVHPTLLAGRLPPDEMQNETLECPLAESPADPEFVE